MPASRTSNVMLGIGLKVLSVTLLLTMTTQIKASAGVPPGELVFFRSFFALVPIFIFLRARRELRTAFQTDRLPLHILRGVVGVTAMSCGFFALTKLPLPEATTINYATPLLIVVLGALVFKEQVRLYRWSAVLVGLAGVLIIVWPRLSLIGGPSGLSAGETLGATVALVGTLFAACATMVVRLLVRTEKSATVVAYFSVTASVAALISLPFGWIVPAPHQWALLIGAGIAGGLGQILLTESYRHADMSIIAPFEYSSLVLSIIIGYFVFGDVPTLNMLGGGVIVVAAGIFIILRERQLGLERGRARQLTSNLG